MDKEDNKERRVAACNGKFGHNSYRAALRSLPKGHKNNKKGRVQVYVCKHCGKFHLGRTG